MLWRPRQQLADGSVIRYQTRRITVSAAGLPDTEVVTAHLAYHIKDFTNAVAMAIATVQDRRSSTCCQIVKCSQVCGRKILHVYVVTNASTVFGVVVGPEN